MKYPIEEIQSQVELWSQQVVLFNGDIAHDSTLLTDFCMAGEAFVKQLGTTDAERVVKSSIHQANRNSRNAFMNLHASEVYKQLTEHLAIRLPLNELVYKAAEAYPGLVPTREQINQELTYIQSDKQGREIDQGIFFAHIMKDKQAGEHLLDSMLQPSQQALEMYADFTRDGYFNFGKITLERVDNTAHVTFHNPSCLNAEDNELWRAGYLHQWRRLTGSGRRGWPNGGHPRQCGHCREYRAVIK